MRESIRKHNYLQHRFYTQKHPKNISCNSVKSGAAGSRPFVLDNKSPVHMGWTKQWSKTSTKRSHFASGQKFHRKRKGNEGRGTIHIIQKPYHIILFKCKYECYKSYFTHHKSLLYLLFTVLLFPSFPFPFLWNYRDKLSWQAVDPQNTYSARALIIHFYRESGIELSSSHGLRLFWSQKLTGTSPRMHQRKSAISVPKRRWYLQRESTYSFRQSWTRDLSCLNPCGKLGTCAKSLEMKSNVILTGSEAKKLSDKSPSWNWSQFFACFSASHSVVLWSNLIQDRPGCRPRNRSTGISIHDSRKRSLDWILRSWSLWRIVFRIPETYSEYL